jgi:hypothetical protein
MVNESVVIQGHEIRFVTVDLAAEAREIRSQLLRVVGFPMMISRAQGCLLGQLIGDSLGGLVELMKLQ